MYVHVNIPYKHTGISALARTINSLLSDVANDVPGRRFHLQLERAAVCAGAPAASGTTLELATHVHHFLVVVVRDADEEASRRSTAVALDARRV